MRKKPKINIVWLKKDLRIYDHAPLYQASLSNCPILPLYIIEPKLWQEPDASGRQWEFAKECLIDLRKQLIQLGANLAIYQGEAVDIFSNLIETHDIQAVYSHEETGNNFTYQRDIAIGKLLNQSKIRWYEFPSNGVVRKLKNRDIWGKIRHTRLSEPIIAPPKKLKPNPDTHWGVLKDYPKGLARDNCPDRQKGGRAKGEETLDSFLFQRGQGYSGGISSPLSAEEHGSRLSPYLTYGIFSIKEILHTLSAARIHHHGKKLSWNRSLSESKSIKPRFGLKEKATQGL